jgi:hypothetical protein
MKRAALFASVVALGMSTVDHAQTPATLEGVWQTIGIADQSGTNNKPQPGVYIFTKKHYSIVEDTGTTERPALTATENSTVAEIMAVFGPAFQSLSGPYQAANGRITFGVIIAKNPRLMKAVNPRTGTYTIANGVLTITQGDITRTMKRLE